MFSHTLHQNVKTKNSRLCVGLDPRLDLLPPNILEKAEKDHGPTLAAAASAITAFNMHVIDAVAPFTAVVKLQSAFYELYQAAGIQAFWDTAEYAQKQGLLVIADAKRGDIDSTATAYADTFLGGQVVFGTPQTTPVDAVTVNPFLGADSLEPFFKKAETQQKGLFILVKTSNPGSHWLQALPTSDGQTVSETIATLLTKHSQTLDEDGFSTIGAVVGATYPTEAEKLRKLMPHGIFLVPGLGAQGGDITLLKHFFVQDGLGAIINSSRGVVFCYQDHPDQFQSLIATQAKVLRDEINKHLT